MKLHNVVFISSGSWQEKVNKVAEDMFKGSEIALQRAATMENLSGAVKEVTRGM